MKSADENKTTDSKASDKGLKPFMFPEHSITIMAEDFESAQDQLEKQLAELAKSTNKGDVE